MSSLLLAVVFHCTTATSHADNPYPSRPAVLSNVEDGIVKQTFTTTALALASNEAVIPFPQFRDKSPLLDAESWNEWILRALHLSTEMIDLRGFIGNAERQSLDMIVTRYKGAIPFEIRQSQWVWVLKILKSSVNDMPADSKGALSSVLASFSDQLKGGIVVLKKTGYLQHLLQAVPKFEPSSEIPFFVKESVAIETEDAFLLCGSKIDCYKTPVFPPPYGHGLKRNMIWFRNDKQ